MDQFFAFWNALGPAGQGIVLSGFFGAVMAGLQGIATWCPCIKGLVKDTPNEEKRLIALAGAMMALAASGAIHGPQGWAELVIAAAAAWGANQGAVGAVKVAGSAIGGT